MEALILCGGYAKRLEPLTEFMPKPLLFIKNAPLVDSIIDKINDIGVNRKIISTNRRFENQFRYWMNNKVKENFELVVEPTIDHSEKFGAVKGLEYAIRNSNINDDLLFVAGDNYFDFDLNKMKSRFEKLKKPLIALYDIKNKEDAKMFGVVSLDQNGKIEKFFEKPENPEATLVSTGIYMFPASTLGTFSAFMKENAEKGDAIGNFIEWLIKHEEVYGYIYENGTWADIGTFTNYRKLFYQFI
ncbi:MAG: nucleotidyltransferase family protein [Candidatus Micrarchaeaceae archaeon]